MRKLFLISYVAALAYLAINLPISDECDNVFDSKQTNESNENQVIVDVISSMNHELLLPEYNVATITDRQGSSIQYDPHIKSNGIANSAKKQYFMEPCAQQYQLP